MTPPARVIREEIEKGGPIPFRRFMEQALYHPELGYYRRPRDPFGQEGDFFTNSQLQPVFGRLISQRIAGWWEELGNPAGFGVVEMGAGRGETLEEVRRSLTGVPCLALERGAGELPAPFTGAVYANEFFDALPVHSVEKRGERLVEHYVDVSGDGFAWTEGQPSDAVLADYIDRYAPGLGEGQKIEVNLEALKELERIACSMQRGFLLTIDYGYTAEEIAGGRRFPDGSLMTYREHQASPDVLSDPGERDITAHVNFTALMRRGEELGLRSSRLRTQAEFFVDLGEKDQFAEALRARNETEALQLRMQLKGLLFGMGETFRVLVQSK